MPIIQNRRRFLAGLSSAGAAGLIGAPQSAYAEPPPEVTRLRLPLYRNVSDCTSPMNIATDLLQADGITDVEFVETGTGADSSDWLGNNEIDFDWNFPPAILRPLAQGRPIKALAGMHGGCQELFAQEGIKSVKDLKGKRVNVDVINNIPHVLLMVVVANVGLDPYKDIVWTVIPGPYDPVKWFADGDIDAFMGGPPFPQQMRTRKLGRVLLNFSYDRPWSQHFCCMLSGHSDFIERYPIATKRVLRAMLKSVDLCASEPERVARLAVDGGFAADYDITLQALREVRYDVWRDFDPEDSIRFYALRMLESGIISANPKDLIAQGTDWRFINELKRELKS